MAFPETRLRRFRKTPALRRLVRETRLSADDLALPLFVAPGEGVAKPISSMPGVFQHSVDRLVETAK
jgi:porphobilinogen synthase